MATVTPHDVKPAHEAGRERGRGVHKGQQTRAAILDAALSLAAQMGIEGLSIGALAEVSSIGWRGLRLLSRATFLELRTRLRIPSLHLRSTPRNP